MSGGVRESVGEKGKKVQKRWDKEKFRSSRGISRLDRSNRQALENNCLEFF